MNFLIKLAIVIIKLMAFTCRRRHEGMTIDEMMQKHHMHNYIAGAWHQNILGSVIAFTDRQYVLMASQSRDGQIATDFIEAFGHVAARGSATRGGTKVIIEMMNIMKSRNIPGGITVDGPRGPLHKVKLGIVEIAKLSGIPLLPFVAQPKHYFSLKKTWDKTKIPYPFTTIITKIGEPIFVPEDADKEKLKKIAEQFGEELQRIEAELNQL